MVMSQYNHIQMVMIQQKVTQDELKSMFHVYEIELLILYIFEKNIEILL